MRSFVRILMLWILILSLPMQGIAAAVNMPCSMAHASMASPDLEVMDGCEDHNMAIPMAQPKAEEYASNTAHQAMPCEKDSHQKHSSCRTCCACHIGASAPPPFVLAGSPVEHFANNTQPSVSSFAGWIPSRIERPPRA